MNTTAAAAIATAFAAPLTIQLALPLTTLSSYSFGQPVLVDRLQPLAQLQHGIAFARQQCVDADARALGELAEREALELLRDEHLALLARQLSKRSLDLLEEQRTHRRSLGHAVRRRQHLIQHPPLIARRGVQQQLRTPPAGAIEEHVA